MVWLPSTARAVAAIVVGNQLINIASLNGGSSKHLLVFQGPVSGHSTTMCDVHVLSNSCPYTERQSSAMGMQFLGYDCTLSGLGHGAPSAFRMQAVGIMPASQTYNADGADDGPEPS